MTHIFLLLVHFMVGGIIYETHTSYSTMADCLTQGRTVTAQPGFVGAACFTMAPVHPVTVSVRASSQPV